MSPPNPAAFKSGKTNLAGTLHLPDTTRPRPALVMLQGSGPMDRDNNGYFPPIRDHFLENGLAVLSWDKPGIGGSTGRWTDQTFFDRADEAPAGIRWLRNQPEIDPSKVGIWGHSQGGWIGPLAASQSSDLAFLIVNSGPGVDVHEQDLYGVEHTLRERGTSDSQIADAVTFMTALHDAAIRGKPHSEVVANILEPAKGTPGYEYFGDVGADLWNFFVINSQRMYDPVTVLERITCPILVIFGEHDSLVPVDKSVRIFNEAQASSKNRDITVKVFPGADHRIGIKEPKGFAPGYLETMTDWIEARPSRL